MHARGVPAKLKKILSEQRHALYKNAFGKTERNVQFEVSLAYGGSEPAWRMDDA